MGLSVTAVLMSNNAHPLRIYLFPTLNVLEKGTHPSGPLVGGEGTKITHKEKSSPKWLCPADRRQDKMGWVSFYMQWAATARLG